MCDGLWIRQVFSDPPPKTSFGKEWVVVLVQVVDNYRIVCTRKLVGGSFNFLEGGPAVDV